MTQARDHYLFEVSWEVCNKVGGYLYGHHEQDS